MKTRLASPNVARTSHNRQRIGCRHGTGNGGNCPASETVATASTGGANDESSTGGASETASSSKKTGAMDWVGIRQVVSQTSMLQHTIPSARQFQISMKHIRRN